MSSEPYQDWISLYNNDIKAIWEDERKELRKVSMIYCAFQNELNSLKSTLSQELSEIRLELKKRDRLGKCKNFVGLAQSVPFDDIIFDKENESPDVPLQELNIIETQDDDFLTQSPNTFLKHRTPSPTKNNTTVASPILRKNSFTKPKRKSTSPLSSNSKTTSTRISEVHDFRTPKGRDDSNIMESSIIDETPDLKPAKKSKTSFKSKKAHRRKLDKSKQATTITQMFFQPRTTKKEIDSNMPSMSVTEMIDLINESSDTDASDETVDDLELPKRTQRSPQKSASLSSAAKKKTPEKKEESPKIIYKEVVRGNERKKLKGWSCEECKNYYEGFDLSPEELQKKKDLCSRHRYRFKPREETYQGFWDLTFGPTPRTQDSEESIVFDYKKKPT